MEVGFHGFEFDGSEAGSSASVATSCCCSARPADTLCALDEENGEGEAPDVGGVSRVDSVDCLVGDSGVTANACAAEKFVFTWLDIM